MWAVLYILNYIWQRWEKIEMVAVRDTNETPIFWVFNSPSPTPRGRWTPEGEGARRQFGVDLSTRCWDIAQKLQKCKNSPLTPIHNNENFIFPFFRPPGAANPQQGRRHIQNQSTPACKLWRELTGGLSRNRWPNKKTNKKTYSKTNTSPFALTSEWRVKN